MKYVMAGNSTIVSLYLTIKTATYYISVNLICQGGNPWSSGGVYRARVECKIKRSGDDRLLSATATGLWSSLSKAAKGVPSKEALRTSTDRLKLSFLVCLAILLDFRIRREANEQATIAMACFDDLREAKHRVGDLCSAESRPSPVMCIDSV